MAPGVVHTPETFQGVGPNIYHHSNIASPMGGPATRGSSTSITTPASTRGTTLNPTAQPFAASHPMIQPQPLPSQQLASHGFGALSDPSSYSYSQQQYVQQQQQGFQQPVPTSMPHLNQPLPAPLHQRPPDPNEAYGQPWNSQYGP